MDVHTYEILALARPGHRGNNGGRQPLPPKVTSVQHSGAVAFLERVAPVHSAVKEGGGAEAMAFSTRGGKGANLKGVQRLLAPP